MNNYAVSSDGIATALQDSASALMEAGNSLEQATALVAAANKVVQDPSSVGSALRTISLRLRGTSVEILEEMGEETDGVVESTSKLQEKLKALTGVDILTDAGAYKDTYTILREIGEVWENLDPMDQAAALELMAGKNRANTLAAILNNMDDLKGAYQDALGAEGSAMRENAAYLDSIQGRIDLFNNSLQTMWMNFLNTDAVKFIIDLGTGLLKLVDSVGLIETALAAVMGYFTLIKKVDWAQGFGALFGKGNKTKLLKGQELDYEILAFNTALSQGPEAFGAYAQGAKEAGNGMDILADKVAKGNIQLVNGKVTSEQYTTALKSQSAAAQQAAKKQKLMNTAVMLTTMAVSGIISAIQSYADNIKTVEERYDELQSSISTIEGDISSLDSELGTIQEQIDALSNKPLTITEAEELRKLKEQSTELQRQKDLRESMLDTYKVQDEAASLEMFNQIIKTTAANQEKAAETGKTWGKVLGTIADVALVAGGIFVTGLSGGLATAVGSAMMGAGMSGAGSSIGTWAGEKIGDSTKQVGADLEEWYESYATAIAEANQQAAEAEAEYLSNVTDDNYDKWQKKLEASNTLQQELYTNLEKLRGYVDGLEYNDTTKATIDGFNDFMTKISLQGIGDDAQSQIAHIQSLEEEFKELSKGVDENGKNIALSADEYARYQSILSQILGLTPSLIQGYNDEGKAIVNKNNLISESIALLQKQNKIAAQNLLLNDDSHILSSYDSAQGTYEAKLEAAKNVKDPFINQVLDEMNARVIAEDVVSRVVKQSTGDQYLIGKESLADYIVDNADAVAEHMGDMIAEFATWESTGNVDPSETQAFALYLQQIIAQVDYASMATSQFKQTLSQIPQASEYYDDLSGSHLSFINAYIDSLDNLENLTDDEVLAIRDSIYMLTNAIGQNKNNQDLINSLFEVDADLAAQVYCDTINSILQQIVDTGLIDEDAKNNILMSLIPDRENLESMLTEVKDKLKDEYDSVADNLSFAELKVAYKFVADKESGSVTGEQLEAAIAASIPKNLTIVATYSELVEQATNYNEILQQTSEYINNNTKVTEEYKEALENLGISKEDIAKCFDDENKLVVTNAKLLNTLVKNAKNNVAANTKLAKSQARLQYYELYKEMKDLTGGMKITDGATLSYVESLYAQMSALEKTISQYSLLEAKLLGTANAYEQLEQAQTQDEANDYGSKAEELVTVLTDAFTTRELGTQAAQVAIEGLIPEDVLNAAKEKAKTDLDGAMQDIYDYFVNDNGVIKKLFKFEFDDDGKVSGVEMTRENVQKFTDELLKAGNVFQGEFDKATKHWDNVTFADGIDSLSDFAEALGTTEEVAFAYLTELEKLDISWLAGDYASLLDMLTSNDLERAIMQNTKDLAELEYRAANGGFDYKGGYDDYVNQRTELEKEAAANEQAARESVAKWTSATEQIEKAQANVDKLSGELSKMDGTEADFDLKQDKLKEAVQELYQAKMLLNGLEEPTEVMLTVVGENLRAEIKDIEDKLAAEGFTVDAVVQLDKESGEYKVVQNGTYTGSLDAETLKTLASLKTQELEVNTLLNNGITTAEGYLSSIDATAQSILSAISKSGSSDGAGDNFDDATTKVKAYITEYKEVDGGATRDNLSIDGLTGHLTSYVEQVDGDPFANALIKNLTGTLVAYKENTGKTTIDLATLNALTGIITKYQEATGETTIDLATLNALTGVVTSYQEATGETTIDLATLNALTGVVTSYQEATGEKTISLDSLNALTGIVIAYQEATNGAPIDTKAINALTGMVVAYQETTGEKTITLNTLKSLAGIVVKYEESPEGVSADNLDSIKALEAEVNQYTEALDCDKSKLLQNFVAKITAYDDSGATMPTRASTNEDTNKNEVKEITAEYKAIAETETASEKAAAAITASAKQYLAARQQLNAFMNAGFTDSDYLTAGEAAKFGIEIDKDSVLSAIEVYQQLEEQLQQLEAPTVQLATFAAGEVDKQIQTLQSALDNNDFTNIDPISLGLKVDANPAEIKSAVESKLMMLQFDKDLLSFFIDLTVTPEDQITVTQVLEQFNQWQMHSKVVPVSASGVDATKKGLKEIDNLAAKSATKTVTVVTEEKSSGTQKSNGSGGVWSSILGWLGGKNAVNGTAHAQGTANSGGSWGAPKTEMALTGELGPELRVRGNRWELLGENGAEFNEVKKGDIIFNHKQTEQLLTNGYITGRGKAFAEGTVGGAAYKDALDSGAIGTYVQNAFNNVATATKKVVSSVSSAVSTWVDQFNTSSTPKKDLSSKKDSSSSKDAKDEAQELFDWIEVRIEEINEDLSLKGAKLENAVGSTKQNAIIDDMLELNQKLYDNLTAGAAKYYSFAEKLLEDIPAEYRKAAQDGSIAIEEFAGDAGKETLEAIQKYREWVQKGADVTQQAEETLTEIQNLAKQAIDNISQEYENKASIPGAKLEQLEAYNALLETDLGAESENIYKAMIAANNESIALLRAQRSKMQSELNAQVEAGNIKKYSQAWYDAVGEIAAVDTEIINLTTDIEDFQDAINELHWDQLDNLMSRFEAISNEAENLIDILGNKDLVDKDTGEWTDEGITSLGLYAQQMEVAEMQAKKYKEEIQYINKNWQKLGYTEQEYVDKLEELKEGQYDSIKAYNDTKKAIVDLNKTRVDEIKNIIQKEIEAYEELIQKQKEALDAEKDLHDFEKTVAEQQKTVADIERKIAALEGDTSASARAQRAKLQAELAKANADLEDIYYDRSMSNKQDALDKELEAFQKEKDDEMKAWDEYLEDTEKVVSDSLGTIQINTETVYDTLQSMGQEYSLFIADALVSPWEQGESAIQSYSEKFGLSMSATVTELKKLAEEYKKTMAEIEQTGSTMANKVQQNVSGYQNATYQEPPKQETPAPTPTPTPTPEPAITLPTKGSKVKVKAGTTNWGAKSSNKKMAAWLPGMECTVTDVSGTGSSAQVLLSRKDWDKKSKTYGKMVALGWANIKDIEGYAKGTTGVKNNQFAMIDELGEELIIRPSKGRMTFMEKGTGVIPSDLTANLMEWGALDPSVMLERNKPEIKVSPEIHNTEFNLTMDIAEVVHIDRVDNETIPDLTKAIDKQLDKYMKNLNSQIRRHVR